MCYVVSIIAAGTTRIDDALYYTTYIKTRTLLPLEVTVEPLGEKLVGLRSLVFRHRRVGYVTSVQVNCV